MITSKFAALQKVQRSEDYVLSPVSGAGVLEISPASSYRTLRKT